MHGYLSSGKSFALQTAYFGRDFEVFAPDLAGFGDNPGMPYPYSLDDYVNEVKEYMAENGITRPHVVAHSFGGRIAIKAAAENPLLFDKIVLCGAAGLTPRFSFKKAVKKAAFSVLKNFLPREKLKGFYSPDYLAVSGNVKESFRLVISERLDGVLKGIENRTLAIYGKEDKETPPYMGKRLARGIKNCRLIILKNAGHFCFIDRPLTFNGEVKEFLLS